MRSKKYVILPIMAVLLCFALFSNILAADYESRFIRSFPPGYNGMWYYTERFFYADDRQNRTQEKYRWDRYMARATNTTYPFYPVPFEWNYGTTENFNLPNCNTNDWR